MAEDIFDKLNDEDARDEATRAQIQKLADEFDFTYDEAFDYVITIGLAYARHPPMTAREPGA